MTGAAAASRDDRRRRARARLATALVLAACFGLVLWVRLLPTRPDVFAADAREHAAEWTHVGDDGREHVYLGDLDSYLWLRHARTLLRTGDACDAVVDGACRDQHTAAPLGAATYYARSLHVTAIAALARVAGWWTGRDLPLPDAARATTLLVALAGVVPAFFLGRRLGGGDVAGAFAVLLTALDARVLARTLGADNDVWTVVLPLYVLWLVLAALDARRPAHAALMAMAAGGCVGGHAWAWRGWPFVPVIVTTALAAVLLLDVVRSRLVGDRRAAIDLRRTLLVLVTFVVALGVATSLTPDGGLLRVAREHAATLFTRAASSPATGAELAFPSGLTMVAELAPLDLAAIARQAGGSWVLVGAWLGIVLLLLPQGPWRAQHRSVFAMALVGGGWLVVAGIGRLASAAMVLGVPLVAATLTRMTGADDRDRGARDDGVVLVVWSGAAIYAASEGLRFYLFAVPPIAFGGAVLVGRATTLVRATIAAEARWYRALATTALSLVLAIASLRLLDPGLTLASRYRPLIDDAWWDALEHLRDTSAPDAIVHGWWETGHWISYVADRRVANDGSSLLTHLPYWTSRALLAPNEADSAGVLRMLSCGSDALPLPEGEAGAYAILRRSGRDPLDAFTIVADVVVRDHAGARAYLEERGLAPDVRDRVLQATHCTPPETYLVVSSALLRKRSALVEMASWDPRSSATSGRPARDDATSGVPFVAAWIPCDERAGEVVCPIDTSVGGGRTYLDDVKYPADTPAHAVLTTRSGEDGRRLSGTPGLVLVAGRDGLERVTPESPAHPGLGVLVDVERRRVLVGAPALIGSTLVQLLYLDGRWASRFIKIDERVAGDERVTTWRLRWPDVVER
ncbi:hypothetical protein K2Z84_13480 [Candidatus Binatia bacterium]|nr:hypothetical protein [Candidatus Binatia bacterium]